MDLLILNSFKDHLILNSSTYHHILSNFMYHLSTFTSHLTHSSLHLNHRILPTCHHKRSQAPPLFHYVNPRLPLCPSSRILRTTSHHKRRQAPPLCQYGNRRLPQLRPYKAKRGYSLLWLRRLMLVRMAVLVWFHLDMDMVMVRVMGRRGVVGWGW